MQQLFEETLGREIADIIKTQISPWRAQIDQLEKRIIEIETRKPEKGERGESGPSGRDGIDGKSIDVDAMVATLVPLLEQKIGKLFADYPKPVDGKNGIDGINGKDGKDGPAGKDGVGISGTMIGRDGDLIITKTDGSMHNVGIIVGRDGAQGVAGKDGVDGAPGRDGFGFDDMEAMEDGLKFGHRFRRGDQIKEFWFNKASLADFDYEIWRTGVTYPRGAVVTSGGSLFICKHETIERPETTAGAKHWRLAVKRGRDGKDGERGERGPMGPSGKDAAVY
jgi:hypothetical protein